MTITSRKQVAISLNGHASHELEDFKGQPAQEIYGELVFNDANQRKYLSKDVYKKLRQVIDKGQPLDAGIANQVAQGMREWALEHGASHYTHWFVPMTGGSAEKHDAMLNPQPDGSV